MKQSIKISLKNKVVGKPSWSSRDSKLKVSKDGKSAVITPKNGSTGTVRITADVYLE